MNVDVKLPDGIGKYPPFMWEALVDLGWNSTWSERDTLDGWLRWEGIIGFTPKIIAAVMTTVASQLPMTGDEAFILDLERAGALGPR